MQLDAKLRSLFLRKSDKFQIIRTGHIREARSELLKIRSDKRIRKMADMISDDHKVSYLEIKVHSTCRIRNEEVLNTQNLHHSDRQSNKLHRIALIIMEASLHRNHELASKLTCNEISLMSDCCGYRKSGDFLVWYNYLIFNLFSKLTQTTA